MAKEKIHFIVSREYIGAQTLQEAFEQIAQRLTCQQFEKWLAERAG
jgi:hypothetical protein